MCGRFPVEEVSLLLLSLLEMGTDLGKPVPETRLAALTGKNENRSGALFSPYRWSEGVNQEAIPLRRETGWYHD
jgi:hypothetical protein